MKGYDLTIVRKIREAVRVPMTVLGGAAYLEDIRNLIAEFGIVGAAAGSIFVFKRKIQGRVDKLSKPHAKRKPFHLELSPI